MWALRLWPLLAVLGWCAFFAAAVGAPVELHDSFAAYVIAAPAGLAILLLVLLSGERPRWPAWSRWLMFACGVALVAVPYALNLHAPSIRALAGLGLVLLALPAGYWIGDRMEKVTNLIPLAVAMSGADVYSVYQGPSHAVSKHISSYYTQVESTVQKLGPSASPQQVEQATAAIREPLGNYLVVHMPVPGSHYTQPVLGIGDFIVLAFLFRAAWVHRLNPLGVFCAGLASVLAALVLSSATGQALPALPVIALGVVGYLWVATPRIRKLDRQEIMLTWIVAALFSALILSKWLLASLHHG
jgi:hypothetical protein